MLLNKIIAAAAVASFVAAPALAASPTPASKLSVAPAKGVTAKVRAAAPTKNANKAKSAGTYVIVAGVVAAVVLGAVVLSEGDSDSSSS